MNEYQSVHNNREKLIKILEARGMVVEDHSIFDRISYSHLIYKFAKHYLIDPNGKNYRAGTKLSHVYNFYRFNMRLSFKLMKALSYLEHELRASISAFLSTQGALDYLNEATYSPHHMHNAASLSSYDLTNAYREIENFVNTLRLTEQNKRSKYDTKHYVHGRLPIWLLVDELQFGQLRMFLKYTKIDEAVLKTMKINRRKWWIMVVANQYRNQISHVNPLVPSIEYEGGPTYRLKDLLLLIKEKYEDIFSDIIVTFNQFNYQKLNLKREYVENYLGIADVFKSYFTTTMKITTN